MKQEIQQNQAKQNQACGGTAAAEAATASAAAIARLESRIVALESERGELSATVAVAREQGQQGTEDKALEAATVVSLEATAELSVRVRAIEDTLRRAISAGRSGANEGDPSNDAGAADGRSSSLGRRDAQSLAEGIKRLAKEAHFLLNQP